MRTSSAKGAKYVSQGQVRAKRSTTPLDRCVIRPRALKVRNRIPLNMRAISLLQSSVQFGAAPRGGALRYRSALPPQRGCRAGDPGWPLATLFRAVGAKSKARCINARCTSKLNSRITNQRLSEMTNEKSPALLRLPSISRSSHLPRPAPADENDHRLYACAG